MAGQDATARRTRPDGRISQNRVGYLFASPWLVSFLALTLLPMAASMLLSFCEWKGLDLGEVRWVGGKHYRQAARGVRVGLTRDLRGLTGAAQPTVVRDRGDEDAYLALKNTFYYAFLAVPLGLCVSLLLALLLNQNLKGMGLFRTVFYMPHVIGGVATIMMWMWVFNPDFGLMNAFLRWCNDGLLWGAGGLGRGLAWAMEGLGWGETAAAWRLRSVQWSFLPPGWLYSEEWAKIAVVIMSLWGAGGAMLIFLAALQNVPEQLYEAARIDGAGRLAQFRHITLPQISPAIFFNLVMGIIGTFQVFDTAYIITGGSGGPGKSLLFYVLYLYSKAFLDFEMGYASALAWILFAIILAMTLLVVRSSALWVYYEGERT